MGVDGEADVERDAANPDPGDEAGDLLEAVARDAVRLQETLDRAHLVDRERWDLADRERWAHLAPALRRLGLDAAAADLIPRRQALASLELDARVRLAWQRRTGLRLQLLPLNLAFDVVEDGEVERDSRVTLRVEAVRAHGSKPEPEL